MNLDQLSMLGLMLDIVGALFLAKGFMAKKIREIAEESATYLDHNSALRSSLIYQKIEAWSGGILLALGFSCQAIPYMSRIEKWFTIGLVLIGVILWFLCRFISKRIGGYTIAKLDRTELLAHIEEIEAKYPDQIEKRLAEWSQRAGVMKIEGESNLVFAIRLKKQLKDKSVYKI